MYIYIYIYILYIIYIQKVINKACWHTGGKVIIYTSNQSKNKEVTMNRLN